MKKLITLFICLSSCWTFTSVASAQEAKCTMKGYKIKQDDFREIVKEFILYERENSEYYSPDWTFVIEVSKTQKKEEYTITISSIDLKSDLDFYIKVSRNKGEIGYINAFGHRILINGAYKQTGLFKATGAKNIVSYTNNAMFNSFGDSAWVEYLFKTRQGVFEKIRYERYD